MAKDTAYQARPMRIQARKGSPAEALYLGRSALPGDKLSMPKAIAPGVDPSPLSDLIFHGGKTVAQMEFQNIYLGSAADWKASDIESIDKAIELAMQTRELENVMQQYFPSSTVSCDMRDSIVLADARPKALDEAAVQDKVKSLFLAGTLAERDAASTLFNLLLPAGTVLTLDDSSSLQGLGGYHGSVHIKHEGKPITLYYSANVYSEGDNGIPVFDKPWKNVVGTLYHEINEFRTDADVGDAIRTNDNDFLGWVSRSGEECGDQPITRAGSLNLIFKQVQVAGQRVPVQFMYSNAVHGAEGPIANPH
jgi:hypothetical protein